jgi:hypothetical protein
MKLIALFLFAGLAGLSTLSTARATSLVPRSLSQRISEADAVCRGRVVSLESFRTEQGGIATRAAIRVDEALKGTFPPVVEVRYRGGTVGHTTQVEGGFSMSVGETRLFFLGLDKNGSPTLPEGGAGAVRTSGDGRSPASAVVGDALLAEVRRQLAGNPETGADVTRFAADWAGSAVQTVATNLISNAGVSSRFLAPDRGEAIHYLVDADAKPAGLTLDQCLTAVSNAFQAWSSVTTCRFVFDGIESFGMAPANVDIDDGRIRIQLHDQYGYITGGSTLGIGGRSYTYFSFPDGGEGGNVRGNEFHPTQRGYVVFKHTAESMQNAKTFEEVACHEIGHVLSMAHSSENSGEGNTTLKQAIMYYLVHADGRGAQLGSYDPPVIQQIYPPGNTPPWSHPRFLHVTTASPAPAVAGVNSVELRGYDLQGTNLALVLTNFAGNNGTFTVAGQVVTFTPAGAFSDQPRLDPESGFSYESFDYRFSDGTNASAWSAVKVLSFNRDSRPTGSSDGIPDNWMVQYFGNANPAVGTKHLAGDDFDGDGASNFQEFLAGTDPTMAGSVLRLSLTGGTNLTFTAQPHDLYELQGTTNLTTWTRVANPMQPTNSALAVTLPAAGQTIRFFRVERVP